MPIYAAIGLLIIPIFIGFLICEAIMETNGKVRGTAVNLTFIFAFLGIFLCIAYFVSLFF